MHGYEVEARSMIKYVKYMFVLDRLRQYYGAFFIYFFSKQFVRADSRGGYIYGKPDMYSNWSQDYILMNLESSGLVSDGDGASLMLEEFERCGYVRIRGVDRNDPEDCSVDFLVT